MNENLNEMVVNQAEALETMESMDDLDPLDARVVANLDGSVREVILVLTTGGPQIEVNATKGTVSGYWGGDTHTTHCNATILDELEEFYVYQFEENVVA